MKYREATSRYSKKQNLISVLEVDFGHIPEMYRSELHALGLDSLINYITSIDGVRILACSEPIHEDYDPYCISDVIAAIRSKFSNSDFWEYIHKQIISHRKHKDSHPVGVPKADLQSPIDAFAFNDGNYRTRPAPNSDDL